jgi:hypothetical protein
MPAPFHDDRNVALPRTGNPRRRPMSQTLGTLQYSTLRPPADLFWPKSLILTAAISLFTIFLPFGDLGDGASSALQALPQLLLPLLTDCWQGLAAAFNSPQTVCLPLIASPLILYLFIRISYWPLKAWELLLGYALALLCGLPLVSWIFFSFLGLFLGFRPWENPAEPIILACAAAIVLVGNALWIRLLNLRQENPALAAILMTYSAANGCRALALVLPFWFDDWHNIRSAALLCALVTPAYLLQLLLISFHTLRRQPEPASR